MAAYEESVKQINARTEAVPSVPTAAVKSSVSFLQSGVDTLLKLKSAIDDAVSALEQQRQSQIGQEEQLRQQLQQFHQDLKRAKDEQEYELKQSRRQKLDELNVELIAKKREHEDKIAQEKQALAGRQAEIEKQEQEFKQLRKQAEEFPAQLEKSLKQSVDSARAEEQTKAKVVRDLLEKQVEGEKAIAKLKIDTLEKTAKDQADEMRMLKSQLERATAQIKDIAVSVIDSKRPIQVQSSN